MAGIFTVVCSRKYVTLRSEGSPLHLFWGGVQLWPDLFGKIIGISGFLKQRELGPVLNAGQNLNISHGRRKGDSDTERNISKKRIFIDCLWSNSDYWLMAKAENWFLLTLWPVIVTVEVTVHFERGYMGYNCCSVFFLFLPPFPSLCWNLNWKSMDC